MRDTGIHWFWLGLGLLLIAAGLTITLFGRITRLETREAQRSQREVCAAQPDRCEGRLP